MPKVRKTELSFLYATRCLVLFYIFAKYHGNNPKGIRVTELDRKSFSNKTKGGNSKIPSKYSNVIPVREHSKNLFQTRQL